MSRVRIPSPALKTKSRKALPSGFRFSTRRLWSARARLLPRPRSGVDHAEQGLRASAFGRRANPFMGALEASLPLSRSPSKKALPSGISFFNAGLFGAEAPNVSLKERALRFGRQKGNRGSGEYTSTSGAHFGASPAQTRCKPGASPAQTPCKPLLLLDSRSTLTTWHSGIAS